MWSVALAVVVTLVAHARVFPGTILFVLVFSTGLWFSILGVGAIWIPLGIVTSSIIIYAFDLIIGPGQLTTPTALAIFGLGFGAILPLRSRLSSARQLLHMCDLPALLTAGLLTLRWPHKTSIDYLGLLAFEDNAAWLGVGSELLRSDSEPTYTGPAIAVLRAAMTFIQITNLGGRSTTFPSDSYILVGLTYGFFVFLATTFAGCVIARLAVDTHGAVRIVLAIGGSAFAYVMLGLPMSTGHLTFIGSLMFTWAALSLSSGRVPNRRLSTTPIALLLIGAMGIWWPLAPFGICVVVLRGVMDARDRGTLNCSRLPGSRRQFVALVLGGVLSIVLLIVLLVMAAMRYLPMGFREFLETKGGLQPLPQNLLLLGCAGVITLFIWRENRSAGEEWRIIFLVLATYALGLSIVAQFVGPDFAINYGPAKLLLFFGILVSPFMFLTPAFLLRNQAPHASALLTAIALVVQGSFVTSWSMNSPRVVSPPSWGPVLLDVVDDDDAIVVCLTSKAERRIDAYVCSRHAAALTEFNADAAAAWRHLVLLPEPANPESEKRADLVVKEIVEQISQGANFVVLAMDDTFRVAETDEWWFSRLPIPDKTLVVS